RSRFKNYLFLVIEQVEFDTRKWLRGQDVRCHYDHAVVGTHFGDQPDVRCDDVPHGPFILGVVRIGAGVSAVAPVKTGRIIAVIARPKAVVLVNGLAAAFFIIFALVMIFIFLIGLRDGATSLAAVQRVFL